MADSRRLIYGVGDMAKLVYRIAAKNGLRIDGFCIEGSVDRPACFSPLPVLPFSEVKELGAEVELLIAIGPVRMNRVRERIYLEAKAAGIRLPNFICESVYRVEPYQLGEGNIILNGGCLHPDVTIGNNNLLASGVTLGHDVQLGDHCFFAGGVVVAGKTKIGDRCFFGLGVTVADNLAIADDCFIGQGCVIARDTEAGATYTAPAAEKQSFSSARFCDLIF